jgi:hypothetical protein
MNIIKPEYTRDATLLYSNVPENDFDTYDAGTTYDIGDTVIYVSSNIHWVVRSLTAGNIGNIPTGLSSDTNWVKVSETNRWKMFDQKTTSQTSNDDFINVRVRATGLVNSLALLNIVGNDYAVTVKDTALNTIYESSGDLVRSELIDDYYKFFFEEREFKSDLVLTDIPISVDSSFEITINNADGVAKCGTALIGVKKFIGTELYGLNLSLNDYSIKTADEFGDFTITERAFSKTMQISMEVRNSTFDSVYNFLVAFRATPVVFIGTEGFTSSYIFGFYKDFSMPIQYPESTFIQLEVEGLS